MGRSLSWTLSFLGHILHELLSWKQWPFSTVAVGFPASQWHTDCISSPVDSSDITLCISHWSLKQSEKGRADGSGCFLGWGIPSLLDQSALTVSGKLLKETSLGTEWHFGLNHHAGSKRLENSNLVAADILCYSFSCQSMNQVSSGSRTKARVWGLMCVLCGTCCREVNKLLSIPDSCKLWASLGEHCKELQTERRVTELALRRFIRVCVHTQCTREEQV